MWKGGGGGVKHRHGAFYFTTGWMANKLSIKSTRNILNIAYGQKLLHSKKNKNQNLNSFLYLNTELFISRRLI